MLRVNYALFLVAFTLILVIGCSGSNPSPVMPGADPDSLLNETPDLSPPEKAADEAQHMIWGLWLIHFDPAEMSIEIEPVRNLQAHFNITSMVQPPACDDCLVLKVNAFDPVTRIMDVDVTLRNKYQVTGYDVRGILYTDTDGHLLTNPDAWSDLWDQPGGKNENPFIVFSEGATHGEFGPDTERTENFLVYIPKPPMYQTIAFAIDASWPGNCKEPYDISDFTTDVLFDSPGSSAEAQVSVLDWQNDVSEVTLEAPDLTGHAFTNFTVDTDDIWKATIGNSEGVPAGDYEFRLYAKSDGSGDSALYQYVTITVYEADSPVVLTIDPEIAFLGSELIGVMFITGENFAGPGAQVKLKAPGADDIVATNVNVEDENTIYCDMSIPLTAWVGIYDVEVTNGDLKSGTGGDMFEVLPWSPVVTDIDPGEGVIELVLEDVTVTGENFSGPGAQVKLKLDGEPDIVATAVVVDNSTTITCDITIPFEAEPGAYDVEVTNGDMTVGVGENLFIVFADAPVVAGILPDECSLGTDLNDVTISGGNFEGPGAGVKLKKSGSSDIVATNVVVEDSHTITCDISIHPSTDIGLYDVEVTNGDLQVGTGEDLFEVLAYPPEVTGIDPEDYYQGEEVISVEVTGSHFEGPGVGTLLFRSGETDIEADNVVVVSESLIECDITIPLNAEIGNWGVRVTNGDGQSGEMDPALEIHDSTPTVTALTPDEGEAGHSYINMQINGTNFIGPGDTTVELTAPGADTLTGTNIDVDDVDTIYFVLAIPWVVQLDEYDVEVTNGYGKTGVGEELYEIVAPVPVVMTVNPNKADAGMFVSNLQIVGSNFGGPGTPTIIFKKPGGTEITATNIHIPDPYHISCDLNIPWNADMGYYNVSVTSGYGVEGIGANKFEVECPSTSVTSISPSHGYGGHIYTDVQVTGSGFWGPGASVTLTRVGAPDIEADNVVVANATTIHCDLDIPMFANLGTYDVEVETGCGESATGTDLYEIRERGWVATGFSTNNDRGNDVATNTYNQPLVSGFYNVNSAFINGYTATSDTTITVSWGWDGAVNPLDIITDSSGNIYVGGYFEGTVDFDPKGGTTERTAVANRDAFLASYEPDGDFRWVNAWGGIAHEEVWGIATDGTYVFATGYFGSTTDFIPGAGEYNVTPSGPYDAYYCWYTTAGAYAGAKTWGSTGGEGAYDIAEYGGYIYIVGTFEGTVDFNPAPAVMNKISNGGDDVFISKFNTTGTFQMVRTFGGDENDYGRAITADAGGIYAVGNFRDTVQFYSGPENEKESAGLSDVFIIKYNDAGTFQWVEAFGEEGADEAYGVCTENPGGNIFVCGLYSGTVDFDPGTSVDNHSNNGFTDAFVSKFESDGDYLWARTWGAEYYENATGVAVDSTGRIYISGHYMQTVDFDPGPENSATAPFGQEDYYLLKLLSNGYWY